jgi:ligand-binding sensor domain-containing protein/serine phosphatase RsbU (regulator of sigma subunit)
MKALLIIICYFCSILISAQNHQDKFYYLTNKDGLSQNSGKAIIQDKFGFIWFGTEMGLDRFDGRNIKSYSHNPKNKNSLGNIYINCLAEDNCGNILIGTDGGGLDYLITEKDSFIHFTHKPDDTNSITNNVIYEIFNGNDGIIWVGTANGFNRIDLKNKSINRYLHTENQPHTVLAFGENKETIWIGTIWGLFKLNKSSPNLEFVENSPKVIERIIVHKENIWISSRESGLSIYDVKTNLFTSFNEINHASNKLIADFLFDNYSGIYIATRDSGLIYSNLDGNIQKKYTQNEIIPNHISSNKLKRLWLDRSGVLWIGTQFDGISYLNTNAKKLNHYTSDKSGTRIFKSLQAITADAEDNIWIGTLRGVLKYSNETNTTTRFTHNPQNDVSLASDFVTSVVEDNKGTIWIGTTNGLSSLHKGSNNFVNYFAEDSENSLTDNSIWGLCAGKDGTLWIATWGGGISAFDPERKLFKNFKNIANDKNSLSVNNTHLVYEDSDGDIWVGTWDGGISCLNRKNGEFTNYVHVDTDSTSLCHNITISVAEDLDGMIWIGTFGGGLDCFSKKTGKFRHYTIENGLTSNVIMGIVCDAKNRLWISTSKGINCIDSDRKTIRKYNTADGIQGNEFSQHGYFITKKGWILFSGSNGFNFFHPDSIKNSNYSPEVIITKFFIKNTEINPSENAILTKPISFTKEINLSYKEDVFSFEFTSTDYSNNELICFAYMMVNFDNEWNYVGSENIAKYTNLNPGEYIFCVKSTNADGVWSNKITELKITIHPPFWKTIWFYTLVFLITIVTIIIIIKLRERKLILAKRILEQKVKERTAEIEMQKEEISAQRDMLAFKNEEIMQQKEEIESQRDEIESQRDVLQNQKEHIEHIYSEITDSILYAKRIQSAILPSKETFTELFPEHLIIFRPKDIVSGDFYWVAKVEETTVLAVADCTGHGVPGAFMSMLGAAFLNDIVRKEFITRPATILRKLRKEIIRALKQKGASGERQIEWAVKDGMDISIVSINNKSLQPLSDQEGSPTLSYPAQWAGANNPLWIVTNKELQVNSNRVNSPNSELITHNPKLIELKGDKMPIAIHERMDDFTNHEIQLYSGDILYLMSDGYQDQFGGNKGKKFMSKNLKQLVVDNAHLSMDEQKNVLENTLDNWIGIGEQIDDISFFGIKIQ